MDTLLNLQENLPRQVKATKGEPTKYLTLWVTNGTSVKFMCLKDQLSELEFPLTLQSYSSVSFNWHIAALLWLHTKILYKEAA